MPDFLPVIRRFYAPVCGEGNKDVFVEEKWK